MTTDEPVPTDAPVPTDGSGTVPPPPDAPLPGGGPRPPASDDAPLAAAAPYGSAPAVPLPPLPTPAPPTASPAAGADDRADGTRAAADAAPAAAAAAPAAPVFGAPAPAPAGAAPGTPAATPAAPSFGAPAATPAAPTYGAPAPHGAPIPAAPHPAPAFAAPHGTPPPPAYAGPGYGGQHGTPPPPTAAAPGYGVPGSPPPYLAPGTGHPGAFTPPGSQPAGKGMAITALVLAGVALLLSWVPFVNYLAGVLAVAGLVVGVVALVKARPGRGMAIAGVVVAVVSVGMVVLSHAVYARVFTEFAQGFEAGLTADEPLPFDEPLPLDEPSTDPSPDPFALDEPSGGDPAADMTVAFGETFVYEDGLEVAVAAPAPYQPSPYASGVGATGEHMRFAVTLTNNTAEEYHPVLFFTSVTSGGAAATEIHDYGSDLALAPSEPVQPGQSVTFEVAYTITDPASVVMEVQPSMITHEPFTVTPG
ncbi:hypothetical protein ACFUMH_18995 [Cellulomonas sp. NPDC057328]|uniref:hypothetical protein n=1 Tax=Cellulomonas sp. NPDC057328 TaxID=3346101 RepID=UPI00362F5382